MSIRAYRVIPEFHGKEQEFNLWHDEELMEALGFLITNQLNDDGCGFVEFYVEDLKDVLKEHEWVDNNQKVILEKMIKQAEEDFGYVKYYCY